MNIIIFVVVKLNAYHIGRGVHTGQSAPLRLQIFLIPRITGNPYICLNFTSWKAVGPIIWIISASPGGSSSLVYGLAKHLLVHQ